MSFLGPLEEFLFDLYPYRWPILIGTLIVLAVAGTVGYLRGWHLVIWQHRLALAVRQHKVIASIVFTPLLGLFIFGGYFTLSPIFQRTYLEEASPLEGLLDLPGGDEVGGKDTTDDVAAGNTTGTDGISAAMPRITHNGEVKGADAFHFGSGRALVIETAPGQYTLRFEDFSVRNGPGLYVYLSPDPDGYAEGVLNLGKLKATDGAFNYEIPSGTDVSQFKSAVVWCKIFSALFLTAPLNPLSVLVSLPEDDTAGGDAIPATLTPTPPLSTGATQTPTSPTPSPTPTPYKPRITRSGEFKGTDDFHFSRGQALLIETAPGRYTLRLEDFSVRNGPDLFVYLLPDPAGYAEEVINLGGLRATDGSFNYQVPSGTDVSQFKSAIIWCRLFAVLFAVAPLSAM